MESYLNRNFSEVQWKNSSKESLQRWRKACGIVKNPKRRFRFTAKLTKRAEAEAEAMRKTDQEKLILAILYHELLNFIAVLVSRAALPFIQGFLASQSQYTAVPDEAKADLFEDEEALQQWQAAPSLSKEYEAEAMGNTNQNSSEDKAALQQLQPTFGLTKQSEAEVTENTNKNLFEDGVPLQQLWPSFDMAEPSKAKTMGSTNQKSSDNEKALQQLQPTFGVTEQSLAEPMENSNQNLSEDGVSLQQLRQSFDMIVSYEAETMGSTNQNLSENEKALLQLQPMFGVTELSLAEPMVNTNQNLFEDKVPLQQLRPSCDMTVPSEAEAMGSTNQNLFENEEALQQLKPTFGVTKLTLIGPMGNTNQNLSENKVPLQQLRQSKAETMGSTNQNSSENENALQQLKPTFGVTDLSLTGPMGNTNQNLSEDEVPMQQLRLSDAETMGSTNQDLEAATPRGPPRSHSGTQDADLGYSVSSWVTGISATGLIGVLAAYLGNSTGRLIHKRLFKACIVSLLGSFVSGAAGLLLRLIIRPNIILPVKGNTWISIGLMTLAAVFCACTVLQAT